MTNSEKTALPANRMALSIIVELTEATFQLYSYLLVSALWWLRKTLPRVRPKSGHAVINPILGYFSRVPNSLMFPQLSCKCMKGIEVSQTEQKKFTTKKQRNKKQVFVL